MLEFNIQPRDGGWFTFPENINSCEIYQPLDYPSEIIEGKDICWIKVCSCELSFSYERHGIHVVFESGIIAEETALAIVKSIGNHVAAITEQPLVIYQS
jgi:hypothetical protein